jgi:hypothetical protein
MNFKTSIICLSILLIGFSLNAQRVNNESVRITYRGLPEQPFPLTSNTYSVSVNVLGDQDLSDLKPETSPQLLIEKYLQLESFRQLIAGGHFHINIQIGELDITQLTNEERKTTTTKDSVKTTTISYYKKVVYRYPITLQVLDPSGEVLLRKVENNGSNGMVYEFKKNKASYFPTIKELDASWEKKKEDVLNEFREHLIPRTFEKYQKLLITNFDTRVTTEKIDLQWPKGKKIPNGDEHDANIATAAGILSKMTADGALEPLQEEMAPVKAFWEAQLPLLPTDDKRLRKVHYACLYNLALVSTHLEQFDEARTYLATCEELGENKRMTNQLTDALDDIEASLVENERPSRHFAIDLSDAVGPEGVDYTQYIRINGRRDRAVQYEGYMITNSGDSLTGNFVFSDGEFREPSFYESGNTIFVYEQDGKTQSLFFDPDKTTKAGFRGRTFIVIDYSPLLALGTKKNIMEVLEGGTKLSLYRYYPFRVNENTENEPDAALVIHKSGEKPEPLSLFNLSFTNWRKSFAAYFPDCEALQEQIRAGEYKRNERRMKDAIRLYNNNDCE